MFQDEQIFKLHAADYDEDIDDATDLDAPDEIDEDEDEEEEEEELIVPSHHAEEADLYAAPSTPADPYEPPTKMSAEPTPIPPPPAPPAPQKVPAK